MIETTPQSLNRGVIVFGWLTIAFVAFALRCWDLENCPNGLFRDEAEKGYSAFSLLHEGGVIEFTLDGSGPPMRFKRWPFLIDVMGSQTSAIYQYASIPFIWISGLTVASTRMAAAVAGGLTVALLGILLLRVWSPAYAFAAMAWLALCPWHYIFSRWAAQGIFVPLGMVGVLAGMAGVERSRPWGFPIAGAALGFVFYAYSGAQPFALLWGALLFALYFRSIREHPVGFGLGVLLFLIGSVPTIWAIAFAGGGGRLHRIAVWQAEDATPLLTAGRFIYSYLAHFSPIFLFVKGDLLPRHGLPTFGQLLAFDLIFLPVGWWTAHKKNLPLAKALTTAFIAGPIGAAITWGHIPHALRSLPMVLPATIWAGVGFIESVRWLRNRMTSGVTQHGFQRTRRYGFPSTLIGLLALMQALYVYERYLDFQYNDQRAAVAFESSSVKTFKASFTNRQEQQTIFINGYIPYAPYFALFFGKLPPRSTAVKGFEREKITFFYRPLQPGEAAPGDWIIDLTPSGCAHFQQGEIPENRS